MDNLPRSYYHAVSADGCVSCCHQVKVFRLESSPGVREARTNVVCCLRIFPLLLRCFMFPFGERNNLFCFSYCWSYFWDQGLLCFDQASFLFIM